MIHLVEHVINNCKLKREPFLKKRDINVCKSKGIRAKQRKQQN